MNRTLRAGVVVGLVAASLSLSACGSAPIPSVPVTQQGGTSSPTPSADPVREALLAQTRADAIAAGAGTDEVECVIDVFSRLSTEELQILDAGTSTPETQAAVDEAVTACFPA